MSATILGLVVAILGRLSDAVGINIGNEELTTTINVILQIGGVILAWWGRWRAGGITPLGLRKDD